MTRKYKADCEPQREQKSGRGNTCQAMTAASRESACRRMGAVGSKERRPTQALPPKPRFRNQKGLVRQHQLRLRLDCPPQLKCCPAVAPPHDALDRRSGTNCLLVVRARATCRAIQKKTVASDARGLSAAAGIPQVSSAEPSSTPMKYPTRLAVVHSHSSPTHGTSRYSIPMYSDR